MRKKTTLMSKRESITGLMFISPWLLGFLAFTAIPMLLSFALMFMRWDFLRAPAWVGLQNFVDALSKRSFLPALTNTLIFAGAATVLGMVLQVTIAAALSGRLPGRNAFRVIFYIPSLVIGTAFGLMMWPIFGNGRFGLLNSLLITLGLPEQRWLSEPGAAVWVMVFMSIWTIGGGMIIFLAGIKGIDRAYYEAAAIDGAGKTRQFFGITLPLLSPILLFQTVMSLVANMQVFDIAVALSMGEMRAMGSRNSLATLVYYMYGLGFRDFYIGQAAVIGWLIFAISLVLCLAIFRLYKRFSYLEED